MSTNNEMVIQILLETNNVKSLDELRTKLLNSGVAAEELDLVIADLTKKLSLNTKAAGEAAGAHGKLAGTISEEEARLAAATGTTKVNTDETKRNTTAKHSLATAEERLAAKEAARAKYMERLNAKMLENNILQQTAIANYSKTYQKLAMTEAMGSPHLMRTATYGAVGLLGLGYESIKKYTEFNKLLVQSVTHAGRKMSEVPFFSEKLLQISKETGQSAHDLAEAMYRVASGTAAWNQGLGASKTQVMSLTRMVSDLTTIGNIKSGAQQEQAARVVTALVNSGMKGIGGEGQKGSARRAAALINSAIGAGDIKLSEMVSAMGRGVMMSGKAAGLRASDIMSWVDLLTSHGTTGSVAGTYVKTAINQFLNPTSQGAKAYAMIGIDPFKLSSTASKYGLGAAVDLFKEKLTTFNPFKTYPKTKGKEGQAGAIQQLQMWAANQFPPELLAHWKSGALSPEEQQKVNSLIFTKAFGGSKGFTTMAMLINESERFHNIQTAIDRNATTNKFEEAKKLAENTPAMQFQRLKNTLVADLIKIGEAITPFALGFGKFATAMIHFIANFKPLLIPIVSYLTVMIGLALKAKTAGILKGMYGPIGSAYRMTDKFWGKMPGEFGQKIIGRGGAQFRAIEEESRRELLIKLGQKFALFGSSVDAFSMSVQELEMALTGGVSPRRGRGAGGGGGGTTPTRRGGGGPAPRPGSAGPGSAGPAGFAPRASKLDRAYLERTRGLRGAFSKDEITFARRFAEGGDLYGKRLTEAEVRRHFGYGRSATDKMLTKDIMDKIGPHLRGGKYSDEAMDILRHKKFGTGGLRTAEELASKAGGVVSKAGGGILSKIGGGLGKAFVGADMLGSILGGPMGLALMTALPMALPYITKGLGSLGSFLGGGVGQVVDMGGTGAQTLTSTQKEIDETKKQLDAALGTFAKGKRTPEQIAKINRLRAKYQRLMGDKKAYTANDKLFAKRAATNIKGISSIIPGIGRVLRRDARGPHHDKLRYTSGLIQHEVQSTASGKILSLGELSKAGLSADMLEGYENVLKPFLKLAKKRGFIKNMDLTDPKTVAGLMSNLTKIAIKNKKTGKFVAADYVARKYLVNSLRAQTRGITGPLLSEATNQLDPNILANLQYGKYMKYDKTLTGDLDKFIKKGNLTFRTKQGAQAKFFSLQTASANAIKQAQAYEKIAHQFDGKTDAASKTNRQRYLAEATHLRAEAKKYGETATKVAQKNSLTSNDIRDLSRALGQEIAKNYGLTPEQFKNAMVAALNQAGGGLAGLVNKHNTDKNART